MNKKGFMFVESLTVLIVLALSLTLLITSYSLVVRKSKESEYYNLPSDKYLLYTLGNLGDDSVIYNSPFVANKNNCSTYMSSKVGECSKLFDDNNMVYFITIVGLNDTLRNSNPTQLYDSPTIEYLKTLKRCSTTSSNCSDNYLVGVFYRNGYYYYASLEL